MADVVQLPPSQTGVNLGPASEFMNQLFLSRTLAADSAERNRQSAIFQHMLGRSAAAEDFLKRRTAEKEDTARREQFELSRDQARRDQEEAMQQRGFGHTEEQQQRSQTFTREERLGAPGVPGTQSFQAGQKGRDIEASRALQEDRQSFEREQEKSRFEGREDIGRAKDTIRRLRKANPETFPGKLEGEVFSRENIEKANAIVKEAPRGYQQIEQQLGKFEAGVFKEFKTPTFAHVARVAKQKLESLMAEHGANPAIAAELAMQEGARDYARKVPSKAKLSAITEQEADNVEKLREWTTSAQGFVKYLSSKQVDKTDITQMLVWIAPPSLHEQMADLVEGILAAPVKK